MYIFMDSTPPPPFIFSFPDAAGITAEWEIKSIVLLPDDVKVGIGALLFALDS